MSERDAPKVLKAWEVTNAAWDAFNAETHLTNAIQAAYEEGRRNVTVDDEMVERAAVAFRNSASSLGYSAVALRVSMRAALEAALVTGGSSDE